MQALYGEKYVVSIIFSFVFVFAGASTTQNYPKARRTITIVSIGANLF